MHARSSKVPAIVHATHCTCNAISTCNQNPMKMPIPCNQSGGGRQQKSRNLPLELWSCQKSLKLVCIFVPPPNCGHQCSSVEHKNTLYHLRVIHKADHTMPASLGLVEQSGIFRDMHLVISMVSQYKRRHTVERKCRCAVSINKPVAFNTETEHLVKILHVVIGTVGSKYKLLRTPLNPMPQPLALYSSRNASLAYPKCSAIVRSQRNSA